MSFYIY